MQSRHYLLSALFCFLSSFTLTSHAAEAPLSVAEAPSWVIANEFRRDYRATDNYPAAVLLSDRQVRLAETKDEYQRYVLIALNATGVQQISQLRITFNPAYHTLTIHRLQVHRDGSTRDVTRSTAFRMLQREERLKEYVQDGYVTALATLEDIRTGDIIEYSYTISGSNPIFDQRYFGGSDLSSSIPIDRLRVRFSSADTRPALNVRVINDTVKPQASATRGWRHIDIRRDSIAAVPDEDGTPPWHSPYAWVEFSEFRDWPDVDRWAAQLYKPVEEHGAAFRALHDALRRKSASREDYIMNALHFVQQDIRYLGLSFGENSHRPHAPAETLARRFGDCKDKSQLLLALLHAEGITAWPALVSTGYQRGIARSLPSPGAFDHVIVAVQHEGKRYFIDGTRLHDGGRLETVGRSDFDLTLLVGGPEDRLVAMYPDVPPPLAVEQFEDFHATDFESPVRYDVRTVYQGNQANYQRHLFNAEPLADIQRRYQAHYMGLFGEIDAAAPISVTDDIPNNRFEVRESWRIKSYWRSEQSVLTAPVRITTFADFITTPQQRVRATPYVLPGKLTARHTTRIHYPASVPLHFSPVPRVLETPHFRYSYTDYASRKQYTHVAELEVIADEVAADEMPAYLSSRKELLDQWQYSINTPLPDALAFDKIRSLRKSLEKGAQK